MALTQVSTGGVKDGSLLNADINASAAIAGSKISPNFGSQAITSTGKVNIGDTQMSQNLLNIEDGTVAAIDIASHGTGGDTAYIGVKKSTGGGLTFGISNRDIIFKTGATYNNGTTFDSGTERMRIDSSGKLAVGTTTPYTYGIATFNDSNGIVLEGSSQGRLLFRHTGGGTNLKMFDLASSDGVLKFRTLADNGTSVTERMRIDSSGRVLIGTSSARTDFYGSLDADLQVEGSGYAAYSVYAVNGNGAFIFGASNRTNNSTVGNISWMSDDGTDEVELARIGGQIDGTPGSNDMPGRIVFSTTADGAASPTERMRIDSSGRVLIGTTTQGTGSADDLTVASSGSTGITIRSGTSSDGNLFFSDGTSGDDTFRGFLQYEHNNNVFRFGTNSAEAMRIDSSGRVGIGATSFNDAAEYLLVKNDSTASNISIVASSNAHSSLNLGDEDDFNIQKIRSDHTDNSLQFFTNNAERMRIDSSGNVGIGTTTPPTGSFHIHLTETPELNLMSTQHSQNNTCKINFGVGQSASVSGNTGARIEMNIPNSGGAMNGELKFFTNSGDNLQERMRINSSGRVLIAETTTADVDAFLTVQVGGASTAGITTHSGTTGNRHAIACCNDNGHVGGITTSGSTTSFNTSSDYRLKENATAISDGISRLKTLKPYRFNWKVDSSTTVDGFFAHEVTAVPEAITGTKDEVDENNKPVYQGIDQSKLVPLLVAAVQELITKVETLEAA